LKKGFEKLKLKDAALFCERDSSVALGAGFRCGFLGLLHLEVVQEGLEREFDLSLIVTAPSVGYKCLMTDGSELIVDNPALYPDPGRILGTEEPYILASIIVPDRYMGAIMKLCQERRRMNSNHQYLKSGKVEFTVELPCAMAGTSPVNGNYLRNKKRGKKNG